MHENERNPGRTCPMGGKTNRFPCGVAVEDHTFVAAPRLFELKCGPGSCGGVGSRTLEDRANGVRTCGHVIRREKSHRCPTGSICNVACCREVIHDRAPGPAITDFKLQVDAL